MDYPNVIAVAAPSRRSGKGTISSLLVREYGYTPFSFARPIKTMFLALCMDTGVDPKLYPRILDGDLKETPVVGPLSLRNFAEGVGTDWGRKMISPDIWVDIAREKIARLLATGKRLVMDDVRYPNEADLARQHGGQVWSVVRPVCNGGVEPTLASEGHLKDYQFDTNFSNAGDVEDLETWVRVIMR